MASERIPTALELRAAIPDNLRDLFTPPPEAVQFGLEVLEASEDDETFVRLDRKDWGSASRWWKLSVTQPLDVAHRNGPGIYRIVWAREDRRSRISTGDAWELTESAKIEAVIWEDEGDEEDQPEPELEAPDQLMIQEPQPNSEPPAEAPRPRPRPPEPPRPQPPPPRPPQNGNGHALAAPAGAPPPPPPMSTGLGAWLPPQDKIDAPLGQFAGVYTLARALHQDHVQIVLAMLESERQRADAFQATMVGFFQATMAPRGPGAAEIGHTIREAMGAGMAPLAEQLRQIRDELDGDEDDDATAVEKKLAELAEMRGDAPKLQQLVALLNTPLGQAAAEVLKEAMRKAKEGAGG